MTPGARTTFNNVAEQATGVSYCGSLIRLSDITDGASNTYLAGEKYLDSDYYLTGQDGSDNECAFIGDDDDIIRWANAGAPGTSSYTAYAPRPDTPGLSVGGGFGSAHLAGFNMAFCDGSVHTLNFSIDFQTHCWLCNRKDGRQIDGKKL
jgi:prepilin-type processing-associated H-X9-DG protein